MITRIVRMTFKADTTEEFLQIFDSNKTKIRNMPGCQYLALHRDIHKPVTFYTISHWDSQADLDAYRRTPLFESTWAATKKLFGDSPSAHSLKEIIELK